MNAKKEFLKEIKNRELVCAKIGYNRYWDDKKWFTLKENYTTEDLEKFCAELDFKYNDGYGGQELFGQILFKDSYSDRHEYDGSEYWQNHKMPTPDDVLNFCTEY